MRRVVAGMAALALLLAGCVGGEDRHERAAAECQRAAERQGLTGAVGFVTSNDGLENDKGWMVEVSGVGTYRGKPTHAVCLVTYIYEGQEWGAIALIN